MSSEQTEEVDETSSEGGAESLGEICCKLVFLISYVPVGNNVLCGLFEAHIQPLQSLRSLIKKPHENDSSYHLNIWQCLWCG